MSIQSIPLSKLVPSQLNVRRSGSGDVDDLAASIEAHGLLQNLTVIQSGEFFEVVAGGRRLKALQQLRDQYTISHDHPVPCLVTTSEAAVEASTAENVIRADMHPADEMEAFRAMVDAGRSVADVATRFGVTELYVRQRMKLANVSPKIIAEFRKGKADMAQMQALALTDDHTAQEAAWFGVKDWQRHPHQIREAITKAEIGAGDERFRFVGLDAYRAAGGHVREDLFEASRSYITDAELLNQLVAEKLQAKVDEITAEGWSWVEARASVSYSEIAEFRQILPERRQPTPEEAKRLAEIDARIREIDDGEEDPTDEESAKLEALTEEHDRITDGFEAFTAEQKAKAGVIVTPGRILYGLLKAGTKSGKEVAVGGHTRAAPGKGDKAPGELSFAAIQRLQADATGILRTEIATLPSIALALLADRLAARVFYAATPKPWVKIQSEPAGRIPGNLLDVIEKNPEGLRMRGLESLWRARLPKRYDELLPHLLRVDINTLTALLAYLIARDIDAVELYQGAKSSGPTELAALTGIDLADIWAPTETWLATLPKPAVIELVRETAGKAAAAKLEKLKKDQLPAAALPLLPDRWLPKPLRVTKPGKEKKVSTGKKAAAADLD